MLKNAVFVFIILLYFCNVATAADKHFSGVIRYDYLLTGTHNTVSAKHINTLYVNNVQLESSKMPDYGNFRHLVRNSSTGDTLFLQGFHPIFKEWQSTQEAQTETKEFYNVLLFPYSCDVVSISIEMRDNAGKWVSMFSDTLKIDIDKISFAPIAQYNIDTLIWSGKSNDKVDIVILAEGYTSAEMDKFAADCRRMIDKLFEISPYRQNKNKFNVLALQTPSLESGVDIPSKNIFRNTVYNSTFSTFGLERYLATLDQKSIFDALGNIACDRSYILVNTSKYGGGGFYNHLVISAADCVNAQYVFVHELTHGLCGLADEYFDSSTSFIEPLYTKGVEPWEPNLTTLTNFSEKWENLIDKNIPIPTPRSYKYLYSIGVFEGGGYQKDDVFSPYQNCWMKGYSSNGFCPICRMVIEKTINLYAK